MSKAEAKKTSRLEEALLEENAENVIKRLEMCHLKPVDKERRYFGSAGPSSPDISSIGSRTRSVSAAERRPSSSSEFQPSENLDSTKDVDFFLDVLGMFRSWLGNARRDLDTKKCQSRVLIAELENMKAESAVYFNSLETTAFREITTAKKRLTARNVELTSQIRQMKAKEEERIKMHLEKLRKRERMIDNLEQHAKAASAEDAQDPYRHTTIRDFQVRLEQLGALMAEPSVLDEVEKPFLDTKGLERIIEQVKLVSQPEVPRVYRPSEGEISFDYVNLSWAHSAGAKDYLVRFWIISGSSCPEEYACSTEDNHYEVSDLQPSSIVTFQVTARGAVDSAPSQFFSVQTLPLPENNQFTLDPETAHYKLTLSSSLNRVRYKGEDTSCNVSTRSDNSRSLASPMMMSPTRFSQALNILGGAQFETGKHYWEVLIGPEEILQSANWIIGVSYHSIPRNAWLGAIKGSWVLHHTPKFLKARSSEMTKIIELENIHLQRLGILMDCDSGRINFVDVHNNKLIFTFVDKFTQPLLAAMNPGYQGAQLQLRSGLPLPSSIPS